jgi:hypothetical protein
VVGAVDKSYMMGLIEKSEKLISKKIRVAVYGLEFNEANLNGLSFVQIL